MSCAFVAQMEGAKHAMCATHDAALRETLRAFLEAPKECAGIPDRWEREDGERERRTGPCCGAAWSRRGSARSRASPRRRPTKRENDAATSESPRRESPRRRRGDCRGKTSGTRTRNQPRLLARDVTPRRRRRATRRCTARRRSSIWTSSLARLVRPASWSLPASPLALGKARRRGSVPPSPARAKAEKNEEVLRRRRRGAGKRMERHRCAPRAMPTGSSRDWTSGCERRWRRGNDLGLERERGGHCALYITKNR